MLSGVQYTHHGTSPAAEDQLFESSADQAPLDSQLAADSVG